MQNEPVEVQEKKPIKRIGWATFMDQAKLERIPNWRDLFDLKKYTPTRRFGILQGFGIIQRQQIFENITPTVGFAALTKAMTGNAGSLAEITVNVHALGTGETAPASSDVQLETEGARSLLPSTAYDDNKAYYTAFYGLPDAIGDWTEMGLFINADPDVADDGVLWDRTLLAISKTGDQSLSIDYEDTFTNDV